MSMTGWCRHYNGVVGGVDEVRLKDGRECNAGIRYLDVLGEVEVGGRETFPCVGKEPGACASYNAITEAEEAASLADAGKRISEHFAVIAAGYCPHCGHAMTQRKVGRCMYATPCNHRLNEIASEIKGTEHVASESI